jgi:ATP-dependent Clp endopeptidase proteolytic subunit ClpP
VTDIPLKEQLKLAELAKIEAERNLYEERAHGAALDNWNAERIRRQIQASSDYARIFPFYGQVNKGAVAGCMDTLTQWHREDPDQPITVVFNSPGGSVFEGLALYDQIQILRNEGASVNTHSLGMAASMGGVLLQAGETRTIGRHGYVLIHEVSSGAIGNTSELEDELKFTKRLQDRLLTILASRSTLTKRQIATRWKRKDWWLDAEEALNLGFVDAIA